jgi:hypothetical protein
MLKQLVKDVEGFASCSPTTLQLSLPLPEHRLAPNEYPRPSVQLADPVPRLGARAAGAGLELPVLPWAHAEAPRGAGDRQARPLPIVLEDPAERRHGAEPRPDQLWARGRSCTRRLENVAGDEDRRLS